MTRREFMIGIGTIGGIGRQASLRIRLTGSAGRRGAELGFEEAARTATLLGWTVEESTSGGAVTIELDRGRVVADGTACYVAASEAARRAALEAWNREHAGSGHAALEWHPDLRRYGAEQLNDRFARRFGERMDAPAWIGWMLVKVPVEAAVRSIEIADGRYDGHKGTPLTFGPDRHLLQPLCIVDERGTLLGV